MNLYMYILAIAISGGRCNFDKRKKIQIRLKKTLLLIYLFCFSFCPDKFKIVDCNT